MVKIRISVAQHGIAGYADRKVDFQHPKAISSLGNGERKGWNQIQEQEDG
jgi:hypothetical protein